MPARDAHLSIGRRGFRNNFCYTLRELSELLLAEVVDLVPRNKGASRQPAASGGSGVHAMRFSAVT